ncbi:calcium homeostasis modulator protein 1 [Triplophysa rosa]|uniref:Calcium homeostasis modulator protein 1-like n=1 Tax=Triplophysa rosa TaxID=992332 RepID=A0A9W7X008_TRIRA|nr:calcium homeostasis modulator protein 1 [Triplophysa rosa]KAI7811171.1 putative calcium homeostasis modulator protein 1-like [Triplophysa rosa]
MDNFRMMSQILQSNQESFMNGICGIMALASAQLYTSFEFNCPCMPEYNYSYGISMLVIPPIWFFMLGFVLNNNVSILAEEWKRPKGQRRKDPSILRYMCVSISQRSLIAPAVWISVTLMDGKSFLCAYSMDLDMTEFGKNSSGLSDEELVQTLAKIPCKLIFDSPHVVSREAATRYIRCISQACGWVFLMIITIIAFLVRAIRPCFTQATFLKTKYWSHYLDIERKMFDETCTEHAKGFAKICIKQYFEGISGEIPSLSAQRRGDDTVDGEEKTPTEEDKLYGIRRQDSMNKVLWDWHACKPPLNLKKLAEATGPNGVANKKEDLSDKNHLNGLKGGYVNPGLDVGQNELDSGCNNANVHPKKNGLTNSYTNNSTSQNGLTNNGVCSPSSAQQKPWAVYYSKV